MGSELRFRDERGVDADAFDWLTPAEELGVPMDDARALYEEALRRAMYPGSRPARDLFLEWLAAWELDEPLADPGRHTLTMRIGQGRRREPVRRSRMPGKRPLTARLDAAQPRRSVPAPPQAQTQAPPRSDDALEAAWRRPGHHLRLVEPEARPSSDELARGYDFFLQRGRSGAPLPSDVATRLGPHVGHDAVRAARLHTDDSADSVAAAHRARAVAIGDEIYFARGEYAPGTARGDELLAHELTHVAQAQRGDLFRAAAKGIDSGTTLDPAEAEAELRAKLAVLQLHAPEGAAPELAAPAGQPTSDGERAARLAAQQQRLELANQDAPADAAVPEPPATVPEAPVEHPAPEMTDAAAAAAAPSSKDSAYVTTFDAAPSKQATELWAKAGAEATTQTTADNAAFEAGLEPLPVELDGDEAPAAAGGGAEHTPGQPPEAGAPPPAATPTPTPVPPPTTAATAAAEALSPTALIEQLMAAIRGMFATLPTTLPADVATEPGPAPVTDLAGQADPARAVGDHQHAMTEGAGALETEREKILKGPGAAQLQPALLDEKLPVPAVAADGAMPELPTVEGMAKFKKWALPAEAQASFDEIAKPKLETNLAEAKARMKEAEVQRDADRAKAVDDAHEKVKQAHVDADKQQQAKVAETRSQIANHQAQTLLKQEKEVKKLEQQSGDKKKGAIGKIQDRLTTDQAKVETDYTDAKTKATDEKTKGEADAAKKKEEAERKANEDKSWWERAADAICDAVKAIADEIDKALDAVAQAIGQILDAVKTAACQLIDAARDFVCQALTEFGDWLKSAVTGLLGSVFPELAAELNQLIDDAVTAAKDAVNAVADGLKTAVTALCDGLKAGIEAAIAAFKAAVQAAATFVQALVTGDWSLVAKMVIDGILQALGIDPAAFYALIGTAQDSLEKIVADPGAFVGHLIDAVKLGFSQFGTNFWTHLQSGVVQWLFGTFSQAGIRVPARFDIAGIFDLVTQVLGLTWTRLRAKVVGLIGEENTERLEFVAGYLEALVTGGFAGLWEKVQQDLSNLWDMVIGGAKDWLIQNVVQQAILKIATMWNPAGAIFQLIQTAWNAYQWLKENAQRIFGLVQAVVDSIAAITAGNISGAANWIEQSLAKLVPIAISLFADLIGLGGLADELRTIIQNVQKAVDDAIDALIERVKALFKGKDGDEDKPSEAQVEDGQVGEAQEFMSGDEAHRLWAERNGTSYVLMIASTPQELRSLLESRRVQQLSESDPELQADVEQAKQVLDLADEVIEQLVAASQSNSASELQHDDEALEQQMRALVPPLRNVMFKVSDSRKAAAIEKLFQEQNQEVRPGSTEWFYGERLKNTLQGFGLAIEQYQSGAPGAGSAAIKAIRGKDKKWSVHQGAIYAPFVAQQAQAINELAPETEDCAFVLSFERGGALVQDQLLSRTDTPSHAIPKRTMTPEEMAAAVDLGYITQDEADTLKKEPDSHKIQQKADLRRAIDEIMSNDPEASLTIAIAETRVGGGSLNYLIDIANTILEQGQYPHLRFKLLALDQTMHRDEGDAEGITYAPIADADRIKVIISSTEYILGEDVAFQLSRSSKHPIIVFNFTDQSLTAYRLTPQEDTAARDIIVDLVDGAYNSFLPGVL